MLLTSTLFRCSKSTRVKGWTEVDATVLVFGVSDNEESAMRFMKEDIICDATPATDEVVPLPLIVKHYCCCDV